MRHRFFLFSVSFVLILIAVCYYFLAVSNFFVIKDVRIFYAPGLHVQELYWSDQIKDFRKKWSHLKGQNLWVINASQIKKGLEAEAWIKDFKMQRQWPDRLDIALIPKKVLAIKVSHRADAIPLADDGATLKSSPLTRSPLVPVLVDSQHHLLQNPKAKEKLVHILSRLPEQGTLTLQQVDEVSIEAGHVYLHLIRDRIKIRLGEGQIPLKVARVARVLEYLKSQNITNRIIDAEFSWKVLVRPNEH